MDLQSIEDETPDITPLPPVPTTKPEQSLPIPTELTSPRSNNSHLNRPAEETTSGSIPTEESAHKASRLLLTVDSTGPSTEELLRSIPSPITTSESSTLFSQEDSTPMSSTDKPPQISPQCVSFVAFPPPRSYSHTQPVPPQKCNLKRKLQETLDKSEHDVKEQSSERESSSQITFSPLILLPVLPRPRSDSPTNLTYENASEPVKRVKIFLPVAQKASKKLSIAPSTQTSSTIPVSLPELVSPTRSRAPENTSRQELEMRTTESHTSESTIQQLHNIEIPASVSPKVEPVTPEIKTQPVFKIPLPPPLPSFRVSQIPLPPMPQNRYAQRSRANTPLQLCLRAVPRIVLRDCLLQPSLRGLLHNVKFQHLLPVCRPRLPHFQPPLPSYAPPEDDEEERKIQIHPILSQSISRQVRSPELTVAEDDDNKTHSSSFEEDLVDPRLNITNDVTTQTDSPRNLQYTEVTVHDASIQTDSSIAVLPISETPISYSVSTQTDSLPYQFPSYEAVVPTIPLVRTIQPDSLSHQSQDISAEASTTVSAQPERLITQPVYEDISTASSPNLSAQSESPKSVVNTGNVFPTTFSTSDRVESETPRPCTYELISPVTSTACNPPSYQQDSGLTLPFPLPPTYRPPTLLCSLLKPSDNQTDNQNLRFAQELFLNVDSSPTLHCAGNRSRTHTPPDQPNSAELQSRAEISNNLLIIANRISQVANAPDSFAAQSIQAGTLRHRRRPNPDGYPSHAGTSPKLIKIASCISKDVNQPRLFETPSQQASRSPHEIFPSTSHYSQAASSPHRLETVSSPLQVNSQSASYHSQTSNSHHSQTGLELEPASILSTIEPPAPQHGNDQERSLPPLPSLLPLSGSTPEMVDSVLQVLSRLTPPPALTHETIQRFLDSQPPEIPSGDLPIVVYKFLQSLPDSLPPPPSAPSFFYNPEHSISSLENEFTNLTLLEPEDSIGRDVLVSERNRLPRCFETDRIGLRDGNFNPSTFLYSREEINRFRGVRFLSNKRFTIALPQAEVNSAPIFHTYAFFVKFFGLCLVLLYFCGCLGVVIACFIRDLINILSVWGFL